MNDRPAPSRSTKRGLTLADCTVLVLGSAIAMSLPRIGAWGVNLWTCEGVCGKAGLALLPLILFRCARLGRDIRPAELLLAVLAAPVLVEAVDWSHWVMSSYMDPIPEIPGGWIPKVAGVPRNQADGPILVGSLRGLGRRPGLSDPAGEDAASLPGLGPIDAPRPVRPRLVCLGHRPGQRG